MTRVTKYVPDDPNKEVISLDGLLQLGVPPQARIRFRRGTRGRWIPGTVLGVDTDGSLAIQDNRGRRRSIPVADVQVESRGHRGGRCWIAASERSVTSEQLGLF